ncbi:MAG: D-alanine--D-alanine ligase family protein, partial [Gemmatimonadales bacterium]
MRIGLAYNQKPVSGLSLDEPPSSTDTFAEWDEPSTIDAVERALRLFGDVVRLEADRAFPAKLAVNDVDIVFNMAEGLFGPNRESHVPAICEYLGVRYTGSDPLALSLALHKGKAKEILAFRGIPT